MNKQASPSDKGRVGMRTLPGSRAGPGGGDAGKKGLGRAVDVTSADVQDQDGGPSPAKQFVRLCPWIETIVVYSGYATEFIEGVRNLIERRPEPMDDRRFGMIEDRSMRTTLRALQYVAAAANTGSVSKAAELLNVSQPSISGAIAQLEADLKLALFVRHHARGISLTPAGQKIIDEARALLAHAEDFERNARSYGSTTHAEISLGGFTTLATRYLPALLSAFARRHPGIRVMLKEGDQSEVVADLLSGRTEFALSYGYALPDDIASEPLAQLPPYLMLAAAHPFADRGSVSLKAMAHEPFVMLDLPYSRDYFLAIFSACGVVPNIAFRSRSPEMIRGLVGHGQGYSIMNVMPRTTTAHDGSEIAILGIEEAPMRVEIMGLRLRRHPPRPAVTAFAALLREAFGPGGFLGAAGPT